MLTNLDSVTHRSLYAGPGSWNDPDMLFVGTGEFAQDHLVEARSHFSLWAILNSPLIIGYDLRKLTPELRAIFGNADIVALNQDSAGNQAVLAYDSEEAQTFVKTLADGSKAVAIFNRTSTPMKAILTAEQLKLQPDAAVSLKNLWTGQSQTFRKELTVELAPRETLVFRVSGQRLLANGRYLSEMPGAINPAVDGVVEPVPDPTIHQSIPPWSGTRGAGEHPQYGGWGGAEADRAPFGKLLRVASKEFGSGLGVLSNSRLEVRNSGYRRLRAQVGVNDSGSPRSGPVTFEVWGDGKLLARSKPKRFGEAADTIEANVANAKIVELIVRGDKAAATMAAQPATWGDAAFLR
jgi:hypothetical protein